MLEWATPTRAVCSFTLRRKVVGRTSSMQHPPKSLKAALATRIPTSAFPLPPKAPEQSLSEHQDSRLMAKLPQEQCSLRATEEIGDFSLSPVSLGPRWRLA